MNPSSLRMSVLAAFAAAIALLAGSLLVAFGQFDRFNDGDAKLRLIGNAANPLTAALLLAAAGAAMSTLQRWVLPAAAGVSFLMGLLALNGVVLDLTQSGNLSLRLGSVVLRLGTLALCAGTVWLWFAKPANVQLAPPQVIERREDDEPPPEG